MPSERSDEQQGGNDGNQSESTPSIELTSDESAKVAENSENNAIISDSKPEKSVLGTDVQPTNKIDVRFKILFILSAIISTALLVTSFFTYYFCFDTCNADSITSVAGTIKLIMAITVLPAILCLYISIKPLVLLKKTTFEKKTRNVLMIIGLVLLFNTVVTPTAIINEIRHKRDVAENGDRFHVINNCIRELVNYNRGVKSAKNIKQPTRNSNVIEQDKWNRYGRYKSKESFPIDSLSNESFGDFYEKADSYIQVEFDVCEGMLKEGADLADEFKFFTDFCNKYPIESTLCEEYKKVR